MAFPQRGISDDFNRANQGPPPSASWVTIVAGYKVDTNQLRTSASSDQGMYWNTTDGPSCERYITLAALPSTTTDRYFELIIKEPTPVGGGDHYSIFYEWGHGQEGWPRLGIRRTTASVDVTLASTPLTLSALDVIGVRYDAEAGKLSGWVNGVKLLEVDDTTHRNQSGKPVFWSNINTTDTLRWDNFGGGSLISAANSTVVASPSSVVADGVTTSTVTVTLKDSAGSPVQGKTIVLTASGGSSTITTVQGTTDASGIATFTVKDATSETLTYTATDTTDSIAITQTVVVAFTGTAIATPAATGGLVQGSTEFGAYGFALETGAALGVVPITTPDLVVEVSFDGDPTASYYDTILNEQAITTKFEYLRLGESAPNPQTYLTNVLALAPALFWPMQELGGTTATDISGNTRNGTYGGTYYLGQIGLPLSGAETPSAEAPPNGLIFNHCNNPSGDIDTTDWIGTSSGSETVTLTTQTDSPSPSTSTKCVQAAVITTASARTITYGNAATIGDPSRAAGPNMACAAGQSVYLHAWNKMVTASGGATVKLVAHFTDKTGALVSDMQVASINPVTGTWYELSGSVTAPTNAAYVSVELQITTGVAGPYTARATQFMVTPTSAIPVDLGVTYADGYGFVQNGSLKRLASTTGIFGYGGGWFGAEGKSPSCVGRPADNSVALDGASGKVTSSYAAFPQTSTRTVMGWAFRNDQSANHALFATDDGTHAVELRANNGTSNITFFSDAAAAGQTWNSVCPTGEPFHWALTWNGSTKAAELYINGVSQGTKTLGQDVAASAGNFEVGTKAAGADWFLGRASHVSIHTTVLSAATVLAAFQAGLTASVAASEGSLDGIYVGRPTYGATGALSGDTDKAVTLNGVDSYIKLDDNAASAYVPGASASFSLELFITLPSWPSATRDLLAYSDNFRVQVNSSGKLIWSVRGGVNTIGTVTSASALTVGTTYHVILVYDGAALNIYINGSLDATAAYSGGTISLPSTFYVAKTVSGTAPTYQSTQTATPITTTAHTCNAPASTQSGELLIAQIRLDNASNTFTASGVPDGWKQIAHGTSNDYIFAKIARASEPASYTWTTTLSDSSCVAVTRISGVDPWAAIDQMLAAQTSGATSHATPTILPFVDNTLLFAYFSIDTAVASTWTESSGTERYDFANATSTNSIAACTQTLGTATSTSVTGTSSQSGTALAGIIPIRGWGGSLLACTVDEISFYTQALGAQQVKNHYRARAVLRNYTWTDVSEDVISAQTKRGRQYELDRIEAGTATIELDDVARAYDPGNPDSPHYPNVLPLKMIRVRAGLNELADKSNWFAYEGASTTLDSNVTHDGVSTLRVTTPGLHTTNEGAHSDVIEVWTDVEELRADVWVNVPLGVDMELQIEELNDALEALRHTTLTFMGTGDWQELELTADMGADTTMARLGVYTRTGETIATTYWIAPPEFKALYPVFRGYVERWPEQWEGTSYGHIPLTAVDGMEALSQTEITGTVTAGFSGASLHQIHALANWPISLEDFDVGQETIVQMQFTSGTDTALPAIQDVADSELGLYFMSAAGKATFQDNSVRNTAPALVSQGTWSDVDDGSFEYIDPAPSFDKDRIINDWRISPDSTAPGAAVQEATDENSIRAYFRRPGSKTTKLDSNAAALAQAQYLAARTANPNYRFDSLSFEPMTDAEAWRQALRREISDRITVERQQFAAQFFIEAAAWNIRSDAPWRVSWQLSPVFYATIWTLDDPVLGLLDSGNVIRF